MQNMYQATLGDIPQAISDILTSYSGILKEDQKSHILSLRNRAYKSHPYPCLGRFRFLELDLASHPLYQSYVLPTLLSTDSGNEQAGESLLLDLGTCLGQDLRKLVYDGVNPQRLWGGDIVQDFIETGYDLFRDRDRLPPDHFLCPADLFDTSPSNKLSQLYGKVTVVHATAVFHLFDLDRQKAVARQCLKLLRKVKGEKALVLGGQAGNLESGELTRGDGGSRFRHNADSWRRMWDDVCAEEEWKEKVSSVETDVKMEERTMNGLGNQDGGAGQQKQIGSEGEGFRWMWFNVWIDFA